MGCGCKKKSNETTQENVAQATVVPNDQPVQTEQQQTQEHVVQVAIAIREMIENKEL